MPLRPCPFFSLDTVFLISKYEICLKKNNAFDGLSTEAVVQRCSVKKVFLLEISQKSQCQSLFFNKVADLIPATLIKRDSTTGVFL